MSDLIFVPKRDVSKWMFKGWGVVNPTGPKKLAVLMHPPGWQNPVVAHNENNEKVFTELPSDT